MWYNHCIAQGARQACRKRRVFLLGWIFDIAVVVLVIIAAVIGAKRDFQSML